MRKYDHLLVDGIYINPETALPFKRGDVYNDSIFVSIRQSGTQIVPYFRKTDKYKLRYGAERSIENIAKQLISSAKKRAKERSASVTIDYNWAISKLRTGVCEFTGLSFKLSGNGTKNPRSASIDRIDSKNRNYTPENSRLVLFAVNCALMGFGVTADHMEIIERMAVSMKTQLENK